MTCEPTVPRETERVEMAEWKSTGAADELEQLIKDTRDLLFIIADASTVTNPMDQEKARMRYIKFRDERVRDARRTT